MKQFLLSLFSVDGEVSSKRVAGFIALFNAIALGWTKSPNEFVFNGFLLFAASVWAITMGENKKSNN